MASVGDLIAELWDWRTRSRAKAELVSLGGAAVGALSEALESPSEGVRWCAASILGEIGGPEAVRVLREAREVPGMETVVLEALERIELSEGAGGGAEPATKGKERSLEELFRGALQKHAVVFTPTKGGLRMEVSVSGGRKQMVHAQFTPPDVESKEVTIYTVCGPANPKHYEWALRQNVRLAHAAIGVMDIDEKPTFVMVRSQLCETADPEELRRAVMTLAERGDALEKALTQEDVR